MINRRKFLGITAGAGATLALSPQLLRALQGQQSGTLIQRAIPSSGEMLPVIGLTFANHVACADPVALKEVLKTFADNGARAFDAMHHSDPRAEAVTIPILNELGVPGRSFLSWRGTPAGGPSAPGAATVREYVESVLTRLKVPRLDLVMVNPANDPAYLAALKELKKEGRVRYIGAQTGLAPGNAALESVMRNEPIDFIGLHYAVDLRNAEETFLPLAQERKIAVMAYYPFGGADTACPGASAPPPSTYRSLFTRVANTPLPEWAAEFDAKSWAQFFLKYVISHPAVTVVRSGTTKATHMLDNLGGGTGRLPDETMRKRMAAFIDSLPKIAPPPLPVVVLPAAILDRYVGEYKAESGLTATFRRDGETLYVKLGTDPEIPLISRSQTRFSPPAGGIVEFRVDAGGTLAGVTVVRPGSQPVQLSRVR
jgi:aryl-alcohol dehydrogenase-like predicted oxidoreductase